MRGAKPARERRTRSPDLRARSAAGGARADSAWAGWGRWALGTGRGRPAQPLRELAGRNIKGAAGGVRGAGRGAGGGPGGGWSQVARLRPSSPGRGRDAPRGIFLKGSLSRGNPSEASDTLKNGGDLKAGAEV